jgi:lysozyme
MIEGLDLSHWRRVASFEAMRAAGIDFVLTKASEGIAWVDETFAPVWAGLQRVNILRGAFHFYLTSQDPERQAEHFWKVVCDQGAENMLPPQIDFEVDGADPVHFYAHLAAIEELFGVKPWIYTSIRYWFARPPSWTQQYFLWVASWYRNTPTLPGGWPTWLIHQYTNLGDGRSLGIDHATVDRNRFAGTRAELAAYLLGGQTPAPEPEIYTAEIRAAYLNVRSDLWGPVIGRANQGGLWEVFDVEYDEAGRPWFWINPRGCVAGWLCDVV